MVVVGTISSRKSAKSKEQKSEGSFNPLLHVSVMVMVCVVG
jgi:hypothetical protein